MFKMANKNCVEFDYVEKFMVDVFEKYGIPRDDAKIIANATKENDCDLILLSDQDEDSWKSFMADNFFKKIINETNVPLFIVKSHLKKINNKSERITSYDVSLPIPG